MKLLRDDIPEHHFIRQVFPDIAKDQLWEYGEGDQPRLCECDCYGMAHLDGAPSGELCGRVARYLNMWAHPRATEPDEIPFCEACWHECMKGERNNA